MSQPPFNPDEFLAAWQRGGRPTYGAVGGEPTLPAIRTNETLDAAEYINQPVEAPPRRPNEGPLFSVVEMADGKGGSAFGIRCNDGLGRWFPNRYPTVELADAKCGWLIQEWKEERPTILIEGFRNTVEDDDHGSLDPSSNTIVPAGKVGGCEPAPIAPRPISPAM